MAGLAHRGILWWTRRGATLLALAAVAGCTGVVSSGDEARGVPCGWHEDAALRDVRSYADVLPNTRFRTDGTGEAAAPLTPLVVVGEVAEVWPGPGWDAEGERTGFDDPDAAWKQVHAKVTVAEVLGSAGWASDSVTVAFPLAAGDDLDSASARLVDRGSWVLPLYRWEGAAPGLWGIGPAHAVAVAVVAGDGSLTLPCVGLARAGRLLADVPTLDALRAAAARPVRERVVSRVHLG